MTIYSHTKLHICKMWRRKYVKYQWVGTNVSETSSSVARSKNKLKVPFFVFMFTI